MRDKLTDGILFSFYGGLLNQHQREIMRLYYDCDMSLGEISEVLGITRQGVRDVIVRCSEKLDECEKQLGFAKKISNITVMVEKTLRTVDFTENQRKAVEDILENIKEI